MTAYVANCGADSVTPIDTGTNTTDTPISGVSAPFAVAITPSGDTAYVTDDNNPGTVTPIDVAGGTAGPPIAVGEFPEAIAITPDQGPTGAFTANTATIGQATNFDASASSDPDGNVADYHWSYGDGDTAQTGSATIDHTYPAPGTYMATLRVTDDEGCSKDQIFTGQTMSCNGSAVAQISHQVTVKASPTLATSATDATLGDAIYDIATLASGHNPTGTITLRAYGPGDATCSNPAAFDSGPLPVSGNGDLVSAHFIPTAAGTYRWTANYSGDAGNQAAASACNAAHETSTVAKANPSVSTNASGGVVVGGAVHDTANLSGAQTPTGNLTFRLYRPGDSSCAMAPVFTNTVPVSGNGAYASANFPSTKVGIYHWTTSYSGDGNNTSASGACNAANESVTIRKASPTLTTHASVLGGNQVGDHAVLAHGVSPAGQIVFRLYRPGDTSCSMAPVFVDKVAVSGSGPYDSARYTANKVGTYRFTAAYSGDGHNNAASDACNAAGESVSVPTS